MQKRPILPVVFFAVIAVLLLSELLFSNLSTLMGNLEKTASSLGLGTGAEQMRLWVLIWLDAIGGVGAAMVVWALLKPGAGFGRIGLLAATLGLFLYGIYQLYAASFQLAPNWKGPILGVGITYIALAGVAWYLGKPLRQRLSS